MVKEYNADSISYLEGLETVRKRPDMYMGSTTGKHAPALFRMVREIIDNSLDEYLIGVNYDMYVYYDTKKCEYAVIDNGRGIPTDINAKSGKSALTLVFSQLHAGGKFDQENYKISAGKNGVGNKGTNALSEYLHAYSNNNRAKQWNCQKFKQGKNDGDVTVALPPKEYRKLVQKTGTIVIWKPDKEIFKDGIDADLHRLKRELKDMQYLCPKLHLHLIIDGEEIEYYSEKGLVELVASDDSKNPIFTINEPNCDVALNFTTQEGNSFKSFVNICNTDMGGTHLNGLKKAICNVVKDNSKQKIANEDILEGIIGAIHYKMSEPQYQSQTKNELTSASAEKDVVDIVTPALQKYFKKNKALLDKIVKYAEEMLQKRLKMKASKEMLKGLDKLNKAAKYISDKFLDADRRKFKNAMDCEMFVVEGDSAGGHFKQAREGYQAALKLRGKVINAAKADAEDLFGSQKKGGKAEGNREIKDLVAALGCGIQENYDELKLRFGKLIIMTDSDVDGQHITNLILAFIINYIPDLIKNGHVYTIDAPLFIANSANYRCYGMTRNDVENQMAAKNIKNYSILRAKGWGECSADEVSEFCLNPKTRKLIKLEWTGDTEEMLNKTMGSDVAFRKELLNIA